MRFILGSLLRPASAANAPAEMDPKKRVKMAMDRRDEAQRRYCAFMRHDRTVELGVPRRLTHRIQVLEYLRFQALDARHALENDLRAYHTATGRTFSSRRTSTREHVEMNNTFDELRMGANPYGIAHPEGGFDWPARARQRPPFPAPWTPPPRQHEPWEGPGPFPDFDKRYDACRRHETIRQYARGPYRGQGPEAHPVNLDADPYARRLGRTQAAHAGARPPAPRREEPARAPTRPPRPVEVPPNLQRPRPLDLGAAWDRLPRDQVCPISLEEVRELEHPVTTRTPDELKAFTGEGHIDIFDGRALARWIDTKRTHPTTRAPLSPQQVFDLVPYSQRGHGPAGLAHAPGRPRQ